MKNQSLLFDFVFTIVVGLIGFSVGFLAGTYAEQDRLNAKCLIEHQVKIHSEAVTLCKERVK